MKPFDTSGCKARGKAFLLDLEKLCEKHGICVVVGSYDHIELYIKPAEDGDRPIDGFDEMFDET